MILMTIGLSVLLYLEDNQRVEGLGRGRGARFSIDRFNTMPIVASEGASAPPGYETFVGMRMVHDLQLLRNYSRPMLFSALLGTHLHIDVRVLVHARAQTHIHAHTHTHTHTHTHKRMCVCAT